MASPISNQPNTIPLHVVYVTRDSIEYNEDIVEFCTVKGLRFSSRPFDSTKYKHDRYEITRLPAMHVYLKNVYQMTIYPNEDPIKSIEQSIAKYKEEQARISSLEWLKKKLKNPFQKRQIWQIQAEIVETPTVFTNPM
jgi:hypothetical protein